MRRFWFFPVFTAVVGALSPTICDAQGWLACFFCQSAPVGRFFGDEVVSAFTVSAAEGLALGVIIGIVAAFNDLKRHAANDPTGFYCARRLTLNSLWIGLYALLPTVTLVLFVLMTLRMGALTPAAYHDWFPLLFFLFFGTINLTAIFWALVRTVTAEDVLTPRVLLGKFRRSTTVTG